MTTPAKNKADPVATAGAGPIDATTLAQVLERLRDQEQKNAALLQVLEQLTGAKPGGAAGLVPAMRKPAELEEPPRVLATRKLLFIGQRLNQEHGVLELDLYPSPDGPVYVCGLGGSPVVFKSTADDDRPHAMVHQSYGDWLIAEDRRRDSHNRPLAARYAWADPEAVATAEPAGE